MNVAVAIAIGIIATLLVAGFGTILILVLLAMHKLQRSVVSALREIDSLRSQGFALDHHADKLVASIDGLLNIFRIFNSQVQRAAEASIRSAESLSTLNSILTGAKPQEAAHETPHLPTMPPDYMPRMDGPRPNVPANPMYDREAPKEDGAEVIMTDDEQMALLQDRQEAREQGFETDPEADFPIPIQGVGADAS